MKRELLNPEVNEALTALETTITAASAATTAHIDDTSAAHPASAISVLDSGELLAADTVEAALAEIETALNVVENKFQAFASADYGVAWASVSLPETPTAGMMVLRTNTNGSEGSRLYIYNGTAWMYVAVTAVA